MCLCQLSVSVTLTLRSRTRRKVVAHRGRTQSESVSHVCARAVYVLALLPRPASWQVSSMLHLRFIYFLFLFVSILSLDRRREEPCEEHYGAGHSTSLSLSTRVGANLRESPRPSLLD